jgi:hypothetical protein
MYIFSLIGWLLVTAVGLGMLHLSLFIMSTWIYFLGFRRELTDAWVILIMIGLLSFSVVYNSFTNMPF